ncbi:MAG: hypothetical protein GF329_06770 [Candidatus Lokiarchaeota archaeon]|nr:hypothetical protein [Candidatus Lokiarchaeota archaeon]
MHKIKFSMPVILVNDISLSKKFYQDLLSLEIENDFGENIVFKDSISLWNKRQAREIIFKTNKDDLNNIKKNRIENSDENYTERGIIFRNQ